MYSTEEEAGGPEEIDDAELLGAEVEKGQDPDEALEEEAGERSSAVAGGGQSAMRRH
ncbi:unnamed protein product [Durusdinium trenchii]|uniref:Uncharacterized protein n=1 Tax=Durusdinium trenchii TaxID=1381693 RepID=A0ABP0SBF8_9DINO